VATPQTIPVIPKASNKTKDLDETTRKPSTIQLTAKAPRMTKKAKQLIEQARREQYAQDLFDELNQCVFKGGLPKETVLKWSNRLLTTAGRARWKRYAGVLRGSKDI
jgi:ABC-type oligopeptide transport system ATPase subunit